MSSYSFETVYNTLTNTSTSTFDSHMQQVINNQKDVTAFTKDAEVTKDVETFSVANLCFFKDTLIITDQGRIKIQDINININTINKKRIIEISKTISPDEYFVCFKKDSLGYNKPDRDLIVTGIHKILSNNILIEAYKFLTSEPSYKSGIYLFKNNKEPVYNILLDTHSIVNANNILAETIDPNNIYAKIMRYVKTPENKKKLFHIVNINNVDKPNNRHKLRCISNLISLYS